MSSTYLLAGGGGLVLILLLIGFYFTAHRSRRGGSSSAKHRGGLTLSDSAFKNQRLGADFILSNIEDGVVMVGPDNQIHMFNPAASKISGWPAEEAVGLDFHNVLQLLDVQGRPYEPTIHPFSQAIATGVTVRDSKGVLSTRGSKHVPVSVIVSPVTSESGSPTGSVVGVLRDITKEKAEESQRSDFISTASHEMRTPIAAVEGYLALALNEKVAKVDDNARKYLQKAATATTHLGTLFADLLTSSKAEDGRLANYPAVVELGEIVEQAAEAARFNAKGKGLDLRYIVSKGQENTSGQVMRPLYYGFVDPNRLREVLGNLIDNAIKYTGEGTVTIRLTGDSSVIQIQVHDTGPGIPPEDLPHLFQKFYRVDSSMTRTVGGTGLGLYISRRIIEMNNGRIWVESQLGKGSAFFINLPRLSREKALELQKRQASQIEPLGGGPGV